MKKMTFETNKDVTMVEFGFLKDNLMFFLYNEGEQSAVGCFLLNLATSNLDEDVKISGDDDCVSQINLHPQDDESIMADCFTLVNRVMSTITVATVCVRFLFS